MPGNRPSSIAGNPQDRVRAGDPDVARRSQLHAAAQAVPVNPRDHRLVHRLQHAEPTFLAAIELQRHPVRREHVEVQPGAKASAGPAHQHDIDVSDSADPPRLLFKRRHQRHIQRVELLRAIQRKARPPPTDLVHHLARHSSSSPTVEHLMSPLTDLTLAAWALVEVGVRCARARGERAVPPGIAARAL
jgi:hypothetical protein